MNAATHVEQALALLNRASADWRNGGQCREGPLHWPVAVNLARRELRTVLEAPRREPDLRELLAEAAERLRGWSAGAGPDGRLIARIEAALRPPTERQAGSAVPADAWAAWKASAD